MALLKPRGTAAVLAELQVRWPQLPPGGRLIWEEAYAFISAVEGVIRRKAARVLLTALCKAWTNVRRLARLLTESSNPVVSYNTCSAEEFSPSEWMQWYSVALAPVG